MKTVVLVHPDGDRVELFIAGRRIDWVHVRRFKSPVHQQMVYDTASDIERALLIRFADLTKRGFGVAEVEPRTRAAIDIPPEILETGIAPLVARRLQAHERPLATGWLDEHEAGGLVAMPGLDEHAMVPHVPSLHGFVLGMEARRLVLDGDPYRGLRQVVPEATKTPPQRAWLRAWLGAVQAAPGTIQELCLRSCRLFDFEPTELAAHLTRFDRLAFVGGFPGNFACAVHASSVTLGLVDPDAEIAETVIAGLSAAGLRARRLAIEVARGRQGSSAGLAAALRHGRWPELRELAVTGMSPATLIAALVDSPLLAKLTTLHIEARFDAGALELVREHTPALCHLERIELRPMPGSEPDIIGRLSATLPTMVELGAGAPLVCPY